MLVKNFKYLLQLVMLQDFLNFLQQQSFKLTRVSTMHMTICMLVFCSQSSYNSNHLLFSDEAISTINPPLNLTVEELVDARIGFFGHVILNVSWIESNSMNACIYSIMIVCSCILLYDIIMHNNILVCHRLHNTMLQQLDRLNFYR